MDSRTADSHNFGSCDVVSVVLSDSSATFKKVGRGRAKRSLKSRVADGLSTTAYGRSEPVAWS